VIGSGSRKGKPCRVEQVADGVSEIAISLV